MGVVIQVGEKEITENDLYPLLAQYGMLPQLVKEMIIDEAIADVICTPDEETEARNRFYQQNQLTDETRIEAWLQQTGMTQEQLEKLSLRDIKVEKYKQDTFTNRLEAYFLQCKGQLDRVVYSLIRTKDPGVAQELYFRVQEQEDTFAELAKKYSKGAEAQTGGLLGPVELNVPHPKIAQMLATSKPGQLWPPTQVGEWLIILRLEKYISAQLDQPTQQRLLNDLFGSWLNEQIKQKIRFTPVDSDV
ncbi:peptidylprolyl isomerase [Aphanothece hegewaldii CCALA 016]|uniref:peptidylprolyl isomerase n=1 Tax=Aphanothece hegewaldii CCALA 016 TaxID=2107694 RepID=A0A2T1M266_9CHRO|nr:peptidylprolyl isomerase [Aphanothece hegewaldii]PSF38788.1 peptidylprolyl isomerase [Aphanothece hegewaldii CCALA 016]